MCLLLDMPTLAKRKGREGFEMVTMLSTCTKDLIVLRFGQRHMVKLCIEFNKTCAHESVHAVDPNFEIGWEGI